MNDYVESRTRVQRRYWRKADKPAGWWPWGLLPLLGLVLLFLYGFARTAPVIESQTQVNVTEQLNKIGIGDFKVTADGQRIRVKVNGQADAEKVRSYARATQCETWAGDLICPTRIDVEIAKQPKMAATAPTVTDKTVVAPDHHRFDFSIKDRAVTLAGELPDKQLRQQIVERAQSRFDSVTDRLSLTGKPATPQLPNALVASLDILDRFEHGRVSWTDGKLAVEGRVSEDNENAVRSRLSSAGVPQTSRILLDVFRTAARCDEDFAKAFEQASIRFRTGSATIDASSQDLLSQLAELAPQCPGSLIVEGHTDSIGDDGMNQSLSQSRAEAVRDALSNLGVPADRLLARGYGEMQPVADNDTVSGRAQNRRIAIKVAN